MHAAELNADSEEKDVLTPMVEDVKALQGEDGVEYVVVNPNGEVVMRTNRETIDDATRQKLTMEEIEEMKRSETGSGKDLVAKILKSHTALDEKTAFALAKYTLRKAKKYMRRFTVLPLDVPLLARWMLIEKEPMKIMEMREEILALMGSWSNVHYGGRYLVVDETGGLIVAAMAEKMGILHGGRPEEPTPANGIPSQSDVDISNTIGQTHQFSNASILEKTAMTAKTNTITLIHANAQPNLSLLKYFDFDPSNPSLHHPLHTHLKTLSWLQLLSPEEDVAYTEPEAVSAELLQTYKSGKRGNYYRKRRRWERVTSVVNSTRSGDFDGLLIASHMSPSTVLHHAIPYLRGGAPVVIYSPNIEPLAELMDLYSTSRRSAFLTNPPDSADIPSEDFPVDPRLLLAPTIQTARCRAWQVLPGRTHPLMTGRGGAEGYVFTGTRVLPAEGDVQARGRFKRRKAGAGYLEGTKDTVITDKANGDIAMGTGTESESTEKVEGDVTMEITEAS